MRLYSLQFHPQLNLLKYLRNVGCYVPFKLPSANPDYSDWLSPATVIDRYLAQPDPPPIINLTGGQPDLVPEWVPWMIAELKNRGLDRQVYLWSDDNLSNDYFWQFLKDADIELIAKYPNYGRVCCFKGFNAESFAFNTRAEPALFDRQFALMKRLLTLGIDLYAYVTCTSPSANGIAEDMRRFVDRLQMLDRNLPLLLLKQSNRPIVGICQVAQDPDFWKERETASFATLMRIENVKSISPPIKFTKRDRRGWVVLHESSGQLQLDLGNL